MFIIHIQALSSQRFTIVGYSYYNADIRRWMRFEFKIYRYWAPKNEQQPTVYETKHDDVHKRT
jgi:hypothetical protein